VYQLHIIRRGIIITCAHYRVNAVSRIVNMLRLFATLSLCTLLRAIINIRLRAWQPTEWNPVSVVIVYLYTHCRFYAKAEKAANADHLREFSALPMNVDDIRWNSMRFIVAIFVISTRTLPCCVLRPLRRLLLRRDIFVADLPYALILICCRQWYVTK